MKRFDTSYRLKQIMEERNLRQVDILNLAKPYCELHKVKLGRNDLSQYVSGKARPGDTKLYILGCALNVSEAWLMGYETSMKREDDNGAPQFCLNSSEHILITKYRKLSDESKRKVRENIDDLLLIDNIKNTTSRPAPSRKIVAKGAKGTKGEPKPKPRKVT